MPLVDELIDRFRDATIFTKLDLRWGYNNVLITPEDRWKAAFRCKYGIYEPVVMFFGLTNSPACFQRFMTDVLARFIQEDWLVVYMDDILIYSNNLTEHRERTKRVLKALRQADLFLKPSKCFFEKEQIEYLGLILGKNQIRMDPTKLQGIEAWTTPRNLKELRSFLGFTNFYRRFIAGYSALTRPLTVLTQKDQRWHWTEEQDSAFQALKDAFRQASFLATPTRTKPFRLSTDASLTAIGAVLEQVDDDGITRPCAFYSRTLLAAERNYDIYDRELLAVVSALRHWRAYLLGATNTTELYTDHKNLLYF